MSVRTQLPELGVSDTMSIRLFFAFWVQYFISW